MITIPELERKVRDRINRNRTQNQLLGRTGDWNKLCSALDIVGDTEQALDAYLKQPESATTGVCYLHVYGALQALQLQQDAVEHICKALRIAPKMSPKLPHIREIRSSAVGHPAMQKENKAVKSSFIVQTSLSQHGFTLTTTYSDGRPYSRRHIDVRRLAAEQRAVLRDVLTDVVQKLDEAEMRHRAAHRDEKLEAVFPETLSYGFSKIFEAISGSEHVAFGAAYVERVSEILADFRQRLEKRGEWGLHEGVAYHYDLLQYPVAELRAFLSDSATSELNEKDAYIFCSFIREEMKNLQQIAREIDEQYAENPADE